MDMSTITAAVTSLRMAGDIAKGLISLNTLSEVQSKAIELNEKIIEAQHRIFEANASQHALNDRVRELEEELARMKAWDTQKQRYKLVAPFPGCMVYALKKDKADGETPHYLCTNCFNRGQPSILLGKGDSPTQRNASYYCPLCKAEAFTKWHNTQAPAYAEDIVVQP